MKNISQPIDAAVHSELVSFVPRELIVAVQEEFGAAYRRAAISVAGRAWDFDASIGLARHRFLNDAFARVLNGHQIVNSGHHPNQIITASCGTVTLGRFARYRIQPQNAGRSRERRELARANGWLEDLAQPDLFSEAEDGRGIYAVFNTECGPDPAVPAAIELIVPAVDLRGVLYREPLRSLVLRYNEPVVQIDRVIPRLRKNLRIRQVGGLLA